MELEILLKEKGEIRRLIAKSLMEYNNSKKIFLNLLKERKNFNGIEKLKKISKESYIEISNKKDLLEIKIKNAENSVKLKYEIYKSVYLKQRNNLKKRKNIDVK